MNKAEEHREFVTLWLSKIKAGEDFKQQYSTQSNWVHYRNMYRNKWEEGILPVNKVYSYGRMLVPRVYFNAPRVSVTASHPAFVAHARVVEAIDNMLIKESHLKRTLKKSILDTFLCGIGPIKLGFDSEYGYIEEQAFEDGETLTQVGRQDGENIEYSEGIKPGLPWAMRCRPEDIILPWGAEDVKNLPWIAHRIIRPLEDVRQDQKYDKTVTKNLKGTRTNTTNREVFRPSEEKDKDAVYVELLEIRDAKTKRMYVLCEEQLLLDVDDALQIDGLPYVFIDFNPDPEYAWSIPDVEILQAQQKELNEISSQTRDHRALALLKFLYDKEKLKGEELQKFLSGDAGPAIGIDADGNLGGAVMPLQPHIPPDLQHAALNTVTAMKESLGFSSNELGAYQGGSPRSATETMMVSEAFEQRVSERKDIVADVLVDIIRKWNQFIFKFWTAQKVVRIVGGEGAEAWITYTGDQLEGEYFLSIDPDSGMPITKGVKYQMAQDLLMKFGGDPMIDQVTLRQIVLESYSPVDPRVPQLLVIPQGIDPGVIAAVRQPAPAGASAGQGSGSGGGRAGSTSEKSGEFDSFRNRFGLKQ